MNIIKPTSTISFPVIVEGTLYTDVLRDVNLDEAWLQQELDNQGVNDLKDVFFASINRNRELHISLKNEKNLAIPTIKH